MAVGSQHAVQSMENQTRFNLNNAIAGWRQDLAARPGMAPERTRELESHLNESIDALKQRGLSDKEAFWVACRRMGANDQIAAEFGRAEPANLWRERVYWMAVGLLGMNLFTAVVGTGENLMTNAFSRHGLGFSQWRNFGVRTFSVAAFVWLAMRLARGQMPGPLKRLIDRMAGGHLDRWLAGLMLGYAGFKAIIVWQYAKQIEQAAQGGGPAAVAVVNIPILSNVLYNTLWFATFAALILWLSPRKAAERELA